LSLYLDVKFRENPIENPIVKYADLYEGFGPMGASILSITYPVLAQFCILDSAKVDYFINKVSYVPLNRVVNPKSYLGDKSNFIGLPGTFAHLVREHLELYVAQVILPDIAVNGDAVSFLKKDRSLLLQNVTHTIIHALFLCVALETKRLLKGLAPFSLFYVFYTFFYFFFCCFLLFWFVCLLFSLFLLYKGVTKLIFFIGCLFVFNRRIA
jgi:hypothetical protein